jgi:hypothetical protein
MGAATRMNTWKLWRALNQPTTAHPIFRQVNAAYAEELYGLIPLQDLILHGQIWFWSLIFIVNTRALVLMVFSGTLYGAIWAMSISSTIAGQRARGVYDLLCLSPTGTVGINWAICTACLHRHQTFEQVNSQEAWSVRLILFVPLVISANVVFERIFTETGGLTLLWLIAFVALFYLDHVQSIIIGSLLGVLAPHYTTNRFDTCVWALGGFILVQVVSYLAVFVTSLMILPEAYAVFRFTGLLADISLPILSVLVFYGVREGIMVRLWRKLTEELNAAPTELDAMFKQARSQI